MKPKPKTKPTKPTPAEKAAEKAQARSAKIIARAARAEARAEAREAAREARSKAAWAARKAKRDAHWRTLVRAIERIEIQARQVATMPYSQARKITIAVHELAAERARLLRNYKAALDAPPGARAETASHQQEICK